MDQATYPEPTLAEQVAASLKTLGLRPVCPEEGAACLNQWGLRDPQGRPWTPATLTAYLEEHDIRPEVLPDMAHLRFGTDRSWNARAILRAIERGPDELEDELRQVIVDDPAVRREVIRLCATVNDNPYHPGLYQEWLRYARQYESTG